MNGSILYHATPIVVDEFMAGSKTAVRFGDGPIIVSPAMMALIEAAGPEELEFLLSQIPLLKLPDYDVFLGQCFGPDGLLKPS